MLPFLYKVQFGGTCAFYFQLMLLLKGIQKKIIYVLLHYTYLTSVKLS